MKRWFLLGLMLIFGSSSAIDFQSSTATTYGGGSNHMFTVGQGTTRFRSEVFVGGSLPPKDAISYTPDGTPIVAPEFQFHDQLGVNLAFSALEFRKVTVRVKTGLTDADFSQTYSKLSGKLGIEFDYALSGNKTWTLELSRKIDPMTFDMSPVTFNSGIRFKF